MYGVSPEVIDAYKTDGTHKEFRVVVNGTSYGNEYIVDDSFSLKQSIMEGEQFEAIGCIASSFSVDLHAQFSTKIRGGRVQVYINAGSTGEIQIFDGYIDKCTKTANGWKRHIEAYDYLYNMSGQSGQSDENEKKKYDITDWFNNHNPTTISVLLIEVCNKFGLAVQNGEKPLVNGGITTTCGGNKKASGLSALDLIKAIMQINGCFGYITGDGKFSWKYLTMHPYDQTGMLYPSAYLYPSPNLYPGLDESQVQTKENATTFIGEYESLEYQDFKMLPINIVKVRNYEQDEEAGQAGSGTENTYIIEGNILIKDSSQSVKQQIAQNIYDVLASTYYVPFNANLPGLPYLQCGDEVNFWDFIEDYSHAHIQRFYILSRTLSGGQHLKDNYSADGNEYLHEFVSGQADNTSTEELRDEIEENYPTNEDVQDQIASASGLYSIVSVASVSDIPNPPNARTLYCIQTEIEIVDSFETNDNNPDPENPDDPGTDPGTNDDPNSGNDTPSGNSISLADLTDVQIQNLLAGQKLVYNGTKWVNQT